MKRIKNIYPQIYSFENLLAAHYAARKNKRYRKELLEFNEHLEENIIEIQNELIWKQYKVSKYQEFYVHEPKKRLVMALPYKDRVVQWAIYRQLNPILERRYIGTSYACRVGYGAHKAIKKIQKDMRYIQKKYGNVYVLKLDIAKYFYRIDHAVAMNIFSRIIADKNLLWLLNKIIDTNEYFGMDIDTNGKTLRRNNTVGMPIGNLTSQMMANLYLNELDQFTKHNLRAKSYIRYMDDIIIIDHSKERLWKERREIEIFLAKKLKLQLNNKTRIQGINQGLDFCGYRVWPDHIRLRKQTAIRMKRHIKKLLKGGENKKDYITHTVMPSYEGMMSHADCYSLRKSVLEILDREAKNE